MLFGISYGRGAVIDRLRAEQLTPSSGRDGAIAERSCCSKGGSQHDVLRWRKECGRGVDAGSRGLGEKLFDVP